MNNNITMHLCSSGAVSRHQIALYSEVETSVFQQCVTFTCVYRGRLKDSFNIVFLFCTQFCNPLLFVMCVTLNVERVVSLRACSHCSFGIWRSILSFLRQRWSEGTLPTCCCVVQCMQWSRGLMMMMTARECVMKLLPWIHSICVWIRPLWLTETELNILGKTYLCCLAAAVVDFVSIGWEAHGE